MPANPVLGDPVQACDVGIDVFFIRTGDQRLSRAHAEFLRAAGSVEEKRPAFPRQSGDLFAGVMRKGNSLEQGRVVFQIGRGGTAEFTAKQLEFRERLPPVAVSAPVPIKPVERSPERNQNQCCQDPPAWRGWPGIDSNRHVDIPQLRKRVLRLVDAETEEQERADLLVVDPKVEDMRPVALHAPDVDSDNLEALRKELLSVLEGSAESA